MQDNNDLEEISKQLAVKTTKIKPASIIVENTSKNVRKIFYYIGVTLVAILNATGDYIVALLPEGALGVYANQIISILIMGIGLIVPYIFGNEKEQNEIKDLKTENDRLRDENVCLKVTNKMDEHLLTENKITVPNFKNI